MRSYNDVVYAVCSHVGIKSGTVGQNSRNRKKLDGMGEREKKLLTKQYYCNLLLTKKPACCSTPENYFSTERKR